MAFVLLTDNFNTIASEAGAQYTLAGLSNTNMSTTRMGDGPNWLNKFNTCIKNGYGIDGAITAACVAYPNWDMSTCVMGY